MSWNAKRFPQILYDRVAPGTAYSQCNRKLSRREWRRVAAAMSINMEGAGIDPNPEVWQLFADKTLLAVLGPMVGAVLIVDRDGFALAMSRMLARKRT